MSLLNCGPTEPSQSLTRNPWIKMRLPIICMAQHCVNDVCNSTDQLQHHCLQSATTCFKASTSIWHDQHSASAAAQQLRPTQTVSSTNSIQYLLHSFGVGRHVRLASRNIGNSIKQDAPQTGSSRLPCLECCSGKSCHRLGYAHSGCTHSEQPPTSAQQTGSASLAVA